MKRFLYLALCFIIACAMTLCFVACGDETPESTASSADTNSSDTTSSTSGTGTSSGDTTSSTEQPQPPAHEHTYEDVLSYDENEHFYKANCEHTDEKKDAEAHTFNKITGFCVCGYYTEPSVTDALESILANRDSVTSGTIVDFTDNKEFNAKTTATYTYSFYDNYVYIKEESDYLNEYYYAYDKNGSVFGVVVQTTEYSSFVNRDDAAYEDNMNGPLLNFNFIGDYENNAYGAEELISVLYEMAAENVNGDFFSAYIEGMFTFGFGVRVFDDYLNNFYVIAVAFEADGETGALKNGAVVVEKYAQTKYTQVGELFVLNEGATPNATTTITIAQTQDALEESENPYDPSKILVDSFIVTDAQGVDIEETTIRVEAGGQIKIKFANIAPETALFSLCTTGVEIVNNEDGTSPGFFPWFNSYDNSYSFNISDPGSYTMTVFVDDIEVVTTIEVALKVPTSISTQVYDSDMTIFNKTTKATVYAGAPLYLMSYVDPDYDGAYVAELVGEATGATLEAAELDGVACTLFKAQTAGTYQVKVTSTVKSSLSATLTITVEEAPSLDTLLSGEYIGRDEFAMTPVKVTFDSAAKTAEVVYTDALNGDLTATISFTTENGFEYTLTSGDDFIEEFYISESYELVIVIYGEKYVLEAIAKDIVATGTIVVKDVINNGKNNATYTFELESNGKFTFYKSGVVTTEISIKDDGTGYIFKFPSVGFEIPLTKTSGEAGSLAGEYDAKHASFGMLANVTITVDEEEQPVKESTTGTLIVEHLDNNGKYSGTYTYEIVDGAFVFYKDGAVTTDVSLTGSEGVYSFKFQGIGSAQSLQKTEGVEGELAGKYKIVFVMHIANVTIVPDPVDDGGDEPAGELTTGTITVVDNNSGAISGTYQYEIVDGAFVIYKDGAVTDAIIIGIAMDGSYTFQCTSVPKPQPLVKVDGEEGVLAGKYNVNFVMDGIFVLTFTPGEIELPTPPAEKETGKLTIVDNNNGAVSGTYTYEVVDGAFIIYKDGTETSDVIITIGLDGNSYTFQAVNLKLPQTLVKVDGEDGVLAGKYNVNFPAAATYVLTFTPDGEDVGGDEGDDGDDPVVESTELVLGDNAVSVPAGGWGTDIPFTSAEGGKFTISAAAGETNAVVVVFLADGTAEMVTLPYTFEAAAGETVTFNICPNNYEEDVIDLVIAVAEEGGDSGSEGGSATGETYFAAHENGTTVTMVFTNTTATSGDIFLTRTTSWGTTQEVYMTYVVVDGVVTLSGANGSSVPYGAVLTVDADGTPLTYTYSGATYELVKQ